MKVISTTTASSTPQTSRPNPRRISASLWPDHPWQARSLPEPAVVFLVAPWLLHHPSPKKSLFQVYESSDEFASKTARPTAVAFGNRSQNLSLQTYPAKMLMFDGSVNSGSNSNPGTTVVSPIRTSHGISPLKPGARAKVAEGPFHLGKLKHLPERRDLSLRAPCRSRHRDSETPRSLLAMPFRRDPRQRRNATVSAGLKRAEDDRFAALQ